METAPAPADAMGPAASVPSDETPPPPGIEQPVAAMSAMQAPRVVQDTLIGPTMSLQVCDNDTYILRSGTEAQTITKQMYDGLLQSHQHKVQSQISISSNITDLRSVKSDDEEPLSWGDMDPELVQRLQADPGAMKVFMATRRPRKEARLDPSLGQFSMTTDVPLPQAPSSSTQPPEIGKETIKEAFQEYHSTVVGPALAEIHSHVANNIAPQIRTLETNNTLLKASLSSVESEMHKRTILIHGVPPFCGKKAIDDNMWYLLQVAELTHVDVQSVSNHLLTSTTSFIRIVFLRSHGKTVLSELSHEQEVLPQQRPQKLHRRHTHKD